MNQINKPVHILLIEDDINLSYLLVENLRGKGFEVSLVHDGLVALQKIHTIQPDLCIIDIMLPGIDGFSIATSFRKHLSPAPFIFLTSRNQEQDKLHGFELGADDFITKPFSFKELYYRIMVALRRGPIATKPETATVTIGTLTVDFDNRLLTVNNTSRKVSQREMGLLQILLGKKDEYVTRSEILKTLWGNDDFFTGKSLDVYVTRIRKLLKDCPEIEIENLYGTGYRIRQNTLYTKSDDPGCV